MRKLGRAAEKGRKRFLRWMKLFVPGRLYDIEGELVRCSEKTEGTVSFGKLAGPLGPVRMPRDGTGILFVVRRDECLLYDGVDWPAQFGLQRDVVRPGRGSGVGPAKDVLLYAGAGWKSPEYLELLKGE